jgi:hypothetical protein
MAVSVNLSSNSSLNHEATATRFAVGFSHLQLFSNQVAQFKHTSSSEQHPPAAAASTVASKRTTDLPSRQQQPQKYQFLTNTPASKRQQRIVEKQQILAAVRTFYGSSNSNAKKNSWLSIILFSLPFLTLMVIIIRAH